MRLRFSLNSFENAAYFDVWIHWNESNRINGKEFGWLWSNSINGLAGTFIHIKQGKVVGVRNVLPKCTNNNQQIGGNVHYLTPTWFSCLFYGLRVGVSPNSLKMNTHTFAIIFDNNCSACRQFREQSAQILSKNWHKFNEINCSSSSYQNNESTVFLGHSFAEPRAYSTQTFVEANTATTAAWWWATQASDIPSRSISSGCVFLRWILICCALASNNSAIANYLLIFGMLLESFQRRKRQQVRAQKHILQQLIHCTSSENRVPSIIRQINMWMNEWVSEWVPVEQQSHEPVV